MWNQASGIIRRRMVVLGLIGAILPWHPTFAADPCIRDDRLYGYDLSGYLWEIDTDSLAVVAVSAGGFHNIAIGSDHTLYGAPGFPYYYRIDACTGVATELGSLGTPTASMGSNFNGELYAAGPPLLLIDPGAPSVTTVGGMVGSDPPDWCGYSVGDIVLDPRTSELLVTLGSCADCGGANMLAAIDPATGDIKREVGCLRDPSGSPFLSSVFGLAFDRAGRLWGSTVEDSRLFKIDTATAEVTLHSIDGWNGAGDLASLPVPICDLMSADLTYPPRSPPLSALYIHPCATGPRLETLHTAAVGDGDLIDDYDDVSGNLRLYQIGCDCTTTIRLVKNRGTTKIQVLLLP